MSICPVCGCKTDELDFVDAKIGETSCRTCSFCEKQLKNFSGESEATEAQLRWLDAVIGKDVADRSADVAASLKALRSKSAPPVQAAPVQPAAFTQPQAQQFGAFAPPQYAAFQAPAAPQSEDAARVEKLEKRIESLENELRSMKRRQLIKSILEIGIPIILMLLILIVFFSSGLYDSLKMLFTDFMSY